MNAEQVPQFEPEPVVIDAALAQNNQISLGARGLALYLLSLPTGSPIGIKIVSESTGTGRDAVQRYMRELEDAKVIVRHITRDDRGRLHTTCMLQRDVTTASVDTVPRPSKQRSLEQRQDVVYVIGQTGSSIVKIGVTRNLRNRLKGIQTGSPIQLKVLWSHPASYEMEARLHAHFSYIRLEGEWFNFGADDPVEAIQVAVKRFSKGTAE